MKAKPRIAGENWELDGTTIIVRIPMTWKRLGGRKAIIAPDGSAVWAPAKPRPDETLIRALARAHRWKGMLEDGTHPSINALAEAEKINRAYVCRLLKLDAAGAGYRGSLARWQAAEAHDARRVGQNAPDRLGRTAPILRARLSRRVVSAVGSPS